MPWVVLGRLQSNLVWSYFMPHFTRYRPEKSGQKSAGSKSAIIRFGFADFYYFKTTNKTH